MGLMRIAIVGAGPAGSYCAALLARRGADVTLFDRQATAWEKPCGGGVPPKVRERFAEVLAYDGPRQAVDTGVFTSPSGVPVRLQSGRPMWIIERKLFDGYLRDLAKQAGAKFTHQRIRRVEQDGREVVLHGAQEHRFDFVIGADGCFSVVRRDLLGPIPKHLVSMTVGYFIDVQQTEAVTWFLPKPGYVWAYPRPDHICLGGGSSDPQLDMWAEVERIRSAHYPTATVRQKWAAPIPFIRDPSFFRGPTTGANFAVIGDAAGHVDALTGEGILYALWGGALLARALLAGDHRHYEVAWHDEYGRELEKTSNLSARFYDPRTMERVFGVAARSATLRRYLMDIMTDQPSYLETGRMFMRRLPMIGLDLIRSLW